ncbi:MAG: M14 family zinc carboxypeptidase [Acidobacteriota bacterium]|nr:M14 family zinc carboxypeptidase [Acidobacteriota bacterium]
MTRLLALLIPLLSPLTVLAAEPASVRVGFLVVDGVYNSELIAPYDIFHHTVFHTDPGMELLIVSHDGGPVKSFEGIEIGAHYSFDDVPEINVLVVPSAEHSMDRDLENETMMQWVSEVGSKADYLVSLCDGAFVLAAAGLLDDVASTTFPGDLDRYEEMFPDLDVRRGVSFVHDGKVLTSQGGARSYDVAMYLVDHLFGEQVALGVGRGMVIDWPDPHMNYVVVSAAEARAGEPVEERRPSPEAVGPRVLPAASPAEKSILPPTVPWNGKSRALVVPPEHEWATPSERTALTRTPRYDETVEWLERLVAEAPELEMISLGKSGEGRDLWMVVASLDGSTPERIGNSDKPVLLAHAGIHSGEIDGKDAGLMLLRDMTVRGTRRELLEKANFLFIPILNVDGHERFSAHNRMNQRGPLEMGWRTNRRNLNLNRDFAKLDTPEIRALVGAINKWRPDLYLDLHVTDGADYQYDITFGYNGAHAWSPAIARWLDNNLTPALTRDLEASGHIPGPLVLTANGRDLSEGFLNWTAGPRFSNGFGDARHLPTVLVENHSLKPYGQRVLGTYVLLESTLRTLGERFESLRRAVEEDTQAQPRELSLGWKRGGEVKGVSFKAIRSELEDSQVTGDEVVRWTGQPERIETSVISFSEPVAEVTRPPAYYIPAAWSEIADRLKLHGIEVELLEGARTVAVEMYRLPEAKLAPGNNLFRSRNPFEGHARVEPGEVLIEDRRLSLSAGSFRVSTNQPLGDLAMLLLEPQSPDSFFQWGFLLEVLSRTEYFEPYVMEPMARRILNEDPELATSFAQKLRSDTEFAGSPRRRLEWFYEKTPYYDEEYRLYPIARARE